MLTIGNAWLRVEREQEADDLASAFVEVSFRWQFCAALSKPKVKVIPAAGQTGPDRIFEFLFVWYLFIYPLVRRLGTAVWEWRLDIRLGTRTCLPRVY